MAQVKINKNCIDEDFEFNERTKNIISTLDDLATGYKKFENKFGFEVEIVADINKSYYDAQYVDVSIKIRIDADTFLFIRVLDNPRRIKSQLFCDNVYCGCNDSINFPSSLKLDEYYILGDMLKVFEEWRNPSEAKWINILKDAIGSA